MIHRNFTAAAPDQKWLTDITQVPCADGKLYIGAVLDCYNGEIVGLAMDDNMKSKLCIRAFESACQARGARGTILHSDNSQAPLKLSLSGKPTVSRGTVMTARFIKTS